MENADIVHIVNCRTTAVNKWYIAKKSQIIKFKTLNICTHKVLSLFVTYIETLRCSEFAEIRVLAE